MLTKHVVAVEDGVSSNLRALNVENSEEAKSPAQRKCFGTVPKGPQQAAGGARGMQVSPTPKIVSSRPTNILEILQPLGLSHYENKFIENDIDIEVWGCWTLQCFIVLCYKNITCLF